MLGDLLPVQLSAQIKDIETRLDSIDSLLRLVVANSILDELDKNTDKCSLEIDKNAGAEINNLLDEYCGEIIKIDLGQIEDFHGFCLLHIQVADTIRADKVKKIHDRIIDNRKDNNLIPYFVFDSMSTSKVNNILNYKTVSFCCPNLNYYHFSPSGY